MVLYRLLRAIFRAGVVLMLVTAARPVLASGPHYVFAHYMVCYSDYGQSLQGFQQDITNAQAAGIDGFALDVGEWNGPDTYYKADVELMYEAAESLGTGFKLFFSVDMANTNDIVQMISTYASRTNSFYYNNALVVSSFCGNGFWWTNGVIQPLQSLGVSNVFFIPFFPTENAWPSVAGVNALLTKYSFVSGLFEFGVGLPTDITNMDSSYGQACQNAGKLFMAGCSPSYWGNSQTATGRTYFESQGGEGTISQWNWIIQNQPDWVEIPTWNDFNEGTYISPLFNPEQYESQVTTPHRYCHAGYLELMKRYISWYKSGQPPPLSQDAVFYFYRTHSTNAIASNTNDIPVSVFMGNVQDVIYNTVLLTAAANLEIVSGTNYITNSLPAGISNIRTPFTAGTQQFTLRRMGREILTVQGPDILSHITNYDYFPASGYAYAPNVAPPIDLHTTTNSNPQF
jgi:glucan endo-1,3-alpha-glucosidase